MLLTTMNNVDSEKLFRPVFNNIAASCSFFAVFVSFFLIHDFMQSVHKIRPSSVALYSRAGRFPVLENIRNEKFPVNMQIL